MKISNAFPSEYLKASDLGGRAITVTIGQVTMEDIGGDVKPMLRFQGKDKGMILNKTNANKIAEAFGNETDDWIGEQIVLYEAMVDFKGQTVAAIRIKLPSKHTRVQKPAATAAEIIDDDIPF